MELNIVNEYKFEFNSQKLFDLILVKTTNVLELADSYVLSVIFCDSKRIHEINREYRKIDQATDVISFALLDSDDGIPQVEKTIELGDIFINLDACKEQAIQYHHSFERELCFLFTHGVLHLLGYDHMNESDEKQMIELQKEILNEIISK